MNKYSELSDVEITKLVAIEIYPDCIVGDETYKRKVGVYSNSGDIIFEYDLFYDCSQAFNLMVDHYISLEFGKNCWHASDGDKLSVSHENPCRAIAECYLLMKDAEIE